MATSKEKHARRRPVKKSSASPSQTMKLGLCEARRSACLHAARAARTAIASAEQQLQFTQELGAIVEAIRHRYERRRAFLQEAIELGQSSLEEALDELRGAELMAVHSGAAPLGRNSDLTPWVPGAEVEELAAMAQAGRGDRR